MNSVHLDLGRRDEFRRARQGLFSACGSNTVQLQADALLEARERFKAGSLAEPELPERRDAAHEGPGLPGVFVNGSVHRALKVGHNTFGRLPDNDVVLQDALISRRHFAILVHSGMSCEVHDLASKNGTFLNGVKLTAPTRLKPGDVIQVGETRVVLLRPGEVVPPAEVEQPHGKTSILMAPPQS